MNGNHSNLLRDSYGRTVRYVRMSVTDRCNLRCLYCASPFRQEFIPHDNILRYEEMSRMVAILAGMGVQKLRLTGGEPFARKGCDQFLLMLRQQFPSMDLRLTSNGTLLEPYIPLLRRVGLGAVNLSLDSFDRATFARVTGYDLLPRVLATLDALLSAGIRVKINVVALHGVNDTQMPDFIHAVRTMPVDVRFIEFMPMGIGTAWNQKTFWPVDEILAEARRHAHLIPVTERRNEAGPARMYRVEGGKGRLGCITALSCHFCADCNRLRLTSNGHIRACLFDDREYRLRGLLRRSKFRDADIARILRLACARKPIGAELLRQRTEGNAVAQKSMMGIGG